MVLVDELVRKQVERGHVQNFRNVGHRHIRNRRAPGLLQGGGNLAHIAGLLVRTDVAGEFQRPTTAVGQHRDQFQGQA
jgi:hypothetical protein